MSCTADGNVVKFNALPSPPGVLLRSMARTRSTSDNTNVTVKPSKGTTAEADSAKLAVCVAASPAWLTNSNNEGATKAVGVLSMVSLNVTTNVPSFKSKALAANTGGTWYNQDTSEDTTVKTQQ
jgi:hypothetical protein